MGTRHVKLTPEQKEKLLRDIWILHDARWFLKSVGEVGFDVATTVNLAVAKSFGRTEIKRLMSETDFGDIKSMEDLRALMMIAADLYFPEEHKYEIRILNKNSLVGHVLECYVYKHVRRAGTSEIHQCAAKTRFHAWLEAMGVEGEVLTDRNTNSCNGTCKIRFNAKW